MWLNLVSAHLPWKRGDVRGRESTSIAHASSDQEGQRSSLEVAYEYFRLGAEHILLGADHLLFVLGLLLIVCERWLLLQTITAFTVAHSPTLGMATLGYASAPLPPLNAAIALSILFLGRVHCRRSGGLLDH
jgi:hydrogenase/urease accessory protein HupE